DRQDPRPQPGHAGAVSQVRLRGHAPHDGMAPRPARARGRFTRGRFTRGRFMTTTPAGLAQAPRLVKCVVWDIDNTLLDGVDLQSAGAPPAPNQAPAAPPAAPRPRGLPPPVP